MLKSACRKGEPIHIKFISIERIGFSNVSPHLTHSYYLALFISHSDIEDKGTSGETFLAAVEYLEREQPAVALFENVDNAPWTKMQEYIQGRLNLSERNSIKNITEIKKGQAGELYLLRFLEIPC